MKTPQYVLLGLMLASGGSAAAKSCNLDRLVYLDADTSRKFVVSRVGQSACSDREGRTFKPTKDKMCEGSSSIFLRGTMDRKIVYAVLSSFQGSLPCCVWFSYGPGEKMNRGRDDKWPVEITWIERPTAIRLDDSWWEIDTKINHPPWPADVGPLRDGEFVPVECRTGSH
jgi:hypothetical protein